MYLKNLEVVGFKSFAERTKLDFERGMTAIVGPNGCGKSNIADAVRWVLGEQSAKALRGSQMTDCIFNGTDTHKPLGMAEVSLTLAECEQSLGTEFHEVTVTRRVFRTGEGQYFINKTPCRLKDIQRLFMDTGIGTNSYSLLEQGRIDLILSSRPEDRREVFEEASGITKFKADKKEAIRKLEHTEANLLRLADIIREVRRQIISLQRQAGKARRYKELQEKLRSLDVYATRERLNLLNQDVGALETRLASISEQEEALRVDVEQTEQQTSQTRAELAATEQLISDAMEALVQAKTELDRAHELIGINRDRIKEMQDLSERDSRDADEARARLEHHRVSLDQMLAELEKAIAARDAGEKELAVHTDELAKRDAALETIRRAQHDLGAESVDLESRLSKLQNELYSLEAQERTSVIRRERLAAEQAELQRSVSTYEERQRDMEAGLQDLRGNVEAHSGQIRTLSVQHADKGQAIAGLRKDISELQSRGAARKAQLELLGTHEAKAEGFPGGARLLLDPNSGLPIDRSGILGSLAEHIHVDGEYRMALEASLRAWLDAVVVSDAAAALNLLAEIERQAQGSLRMLGLKDSPAIGAAFLDGAGERLVDHVHCSPEIRPLVERLLHNVRVVSQLAEMPQPLAPEAIYVTRGGSLVRGTGSFELWMPESGEISPVAREQMLAEWKRELDEIQRHIAQKEEALGALLSDDRSVEEAIQQTRTHLEDGQKKLAQREGELHIISQEASQARERAETVDWELNVLKEQQNSGGDRRTSIREEMEQVRNRQAEVRAAMTAKADELRVVEQERSDRAAEVSDARVRFVERRQEVEHLTARKEPMQARIAELEALIQNRAEGISAYQARIQELQVSIQATEARLDPMKEEVTRHTARLDEARAKRDEQMKVLSSCDAVLREKRGRLDDVRSKKSQIDVELAEQRIRRQNLIERVAAEYHITPEQMLQEPEPVWENDQKLDREALETTIAELRTKIEAMGPVNLVAIEEHRELEERFTFLSQQQEDLIKAKQQLTELIRRINKTTTDMFFQTFQQVNTNFQEMFKKLFGGGSAKLVLVNEEDVLESGIEIIARPPGKKLQTVSLLSGGERTMTAVALLFSLYMVKPSPFCLLDELDAALDEANIGRFVKAVRDFLVNSQFLVITHNRQTISAAEALYGVTMEQNGVSKIMSVKFSHHEKKDESPAQAAPAPVATATAVEEEPAPEAEPPVPAEAAVENEPVAGEEPQAVVASEPTPAAAEPAPEPPPAG